MSLASRWSAESPAALRLLVLAVADRCDQRCVHCQIWAGGAGGRPGLTLQERLCVVDDALAAGVQEALLTGGEPLLSPDLWPVAQRLHAGSVRLMLATNGMLLARHAGEVGRLFSEVYVSLDGASPATHDGLRGVAGFERLRQGVDALRCAAPRVRIVARSTLHARNLHELEGIAEAARRMGFHGVSFLALDARSAAFGGDPGARRLLVPVPEQVAALEASIARMEATGLLDGGFVLESAGKLRRIALHLRASGGHVPFERPECDAPKWSSVVEADGAVRPCFFHGPVGDAREGLATLRSSPRYREALAAIRAPNATCEQCVCPKKRGTALVERLHA